MKNRFFRFLVCSLVIGCLIFSLSPLSVRAVDPFTMGVLSAPETLPIILGWLGITQNPAAPDDFIQVQNGLSEHLKAQGYIIDNSIRAAFYMTSPVPGDKVKAIPYLDKVMLGSIVDWLYTGTAKT